MIGIVHSTVNKVLRRYIFPDDDAELATHPLAPGESMLTVDLATWQAAADAIAAGTVTLPIGVTPRSFSPAEIIIANTFGTVGNPRCAIVDGTGKCVGVGLLDPLVDQAPTGTTLMLSTTLKPGQVIGVQPPTVAPTVLGGNVTAAP